MPGVENTDQISASPLVNPLQGRHAFVTGASRGIGAAIAMELGRLGATLSLTGRDEDALSEQMEAVGSRHGGYVGAYVMDVTDGYEIAHIFAKAAEDAGGSVDILVNNAGAATSAPFPRITPDAWRAMLEVNLTGPYLCTQAVLPGMLEKRSGRIINVASTAGHKGYAYVAPYCASKHGVIGMTRALALEIAPSGVTVNAVCPGFTETDIAARTIETMVEKTGRDRDEAYAELAKFNPQARLVQPEEVAQAVGWLALPSSGSINGQSIMVDGGEVMS